jgi:hypothetical protein
MAQILENLQSTVIFSEADITGVESYIATQYSTFSEEDIHKILIHYLQQKMERDFACFDPKYLSYVRSRLIQNILDRRPYHVMAIDIIKACMQLNVQFDDFYTGLRQWMLSLHCPTVSESEIDRFIVQLRHLMRDHPELSFDELIHTHKHLFATETAAPTVPARTEALSQTKSESFSSTVKLFLDEFDWNPLETDESAPPKRSFAVTKVILAGLAGLLMSVTIGIWLTLSFDKGSARQIASRSWNQRAAVQAQVASETSVSRDEAGLPARIGANSIVNRSRTLVRSTPVPDNAELQKKTDKSGELPEIKPAIVDYQEVTKNGTTSKVPVFHYFSKKLVAPIRIYSRIPDDNAPDNENAGDEKYPGKTKETAKQKTVVAESGTVAPGSRVYLKFPQEYRYLNGVYLTETPDSANGDTQISIVSKDDQAAKEGMVPTFDCNQVEVYVLDRSE